MKAILLSAYGDVGQLALRYVPEPIPKPGEVKVRMAAASINPIDWKLRSGELHAFMPLTFPAILGRDVSGTVVALGDGVTELKLGQRVMGLVSSAYAEFVVAPAAAFAEVPARLDLASAGALPLVLLTGAQLVEEGVKPAAGDVVLVTGAAGSVGRAAVFAAKQLGASVWVAVRAAQKAVASKLGAAGVVAIDDDAEIATLPELDAIADTVGGDAIQKLLGKLKPHGTIASVVGEPAGAKERGFVVRGVMAHADSKQLAGLAAAVADGTLVIPIARSFSLSRIRDAQRLAEHHAGGKVIVTGAPVSSRAPGPAPAGRHM